MLSQKLIQEKRTVIQLNAWESDYDGDPLFGIVNSLLEQTDSTETQAIEEAARKVGAFSLSVRNQLLAQLTGVNVKEAAEQAQQIAPLSHSEFDRCRARKSELNNLQSSLNDFFMQSDQPVIFFVDELDRCRPDYAISYLEVIKHIFALENAIFILAFDKKQLRNSAEHAFGAKIEFEEYLRKFIHREIELPRVRNYTSFTRKYIEDFLENSDIRRAAIQDMETFSVRVVGLFERTEPTLRQAQEILRVLSYVLQAEHETEKFLRWPFAIGAALLATLKVKYCAQYEVLTTSGLHIEEAIKLIRSLSDDASYQWWLSMFIAANATNPVLYQDVEELLKQYLSDDELDNWAPRDL